jgi:seryl-tRNA synthetase
MSKKKKPKPKETRMTQDEAVAALTKTNETLVKISNETDALLREINKLNQALAAAIEAGRMITPELEAAIHATDARAHAIDELVPDVPPPETGKRK